MKKVPAMTDIVGGVVFPLEYGKLSRRFNSNDLSMSTFLASTSYA